MLSFKISCRQFLPVLLLISLALKIDFGAAFGENVSDDPLTWQDAVNALRKKQVEVQIRNANGELVGYGMPSSASDVISVGLTNEADLPLLVRFFPELEEIDLKSLRITDQGLRILQSFKHLKALQLRRAEAPIETEKPAAPQSWVQ